MRKQLSKFALTASLVLAMAFTFSCSSSSDNDGKDADPSSSSGGGVSSSSGGGGSSSSQDGSSSSSSIANNGLCSNFNPNAEVEHQGKKKKQLCDERDGKRYFYVPIGGKNWMAENLKYEAPDSKCDANATTCDTYGRLYEWTRAMQGSGICPNGWYIPSNAEWEALMLAIGGIESYGRYLGAGTPLKTVSGWNNDGNGTDSYGFSALPGGRGDYEGGSGPFSISNVGNAGHWWTSSLKSSYEALNWSTGSNNGDMQRHASFTNGMFFSVRCVQMGYLSSSSSGTGNSSSSGGISACPNTTTGNGTVTCGGQTYETVVIGTQTWMAENLNYDVAGSKCYGEDKQVYDDNYNLITLTDEEIQANCAEYGRLYDWATAMKLPSKCKDVFSVSDAECAIETSHRGLCPAGYHIPTNEDFAKLTNYVESNSGCGSCAAKYLRAKDSWQDCGISGSGKTYLCEDTYGFTALAGGIGDSEVYFNAGNNGYWWSSNESISSNYAYNWMMSGYQDFSGIDIYSKSNLLSIRCVRN